MLLYDCCNNIKIKYDTSFKRESKLIDEWEMEGNTTWLIFLQQRGQFVICILYE